MEMIAAVTFQVQASITHSLGLWCREAHVSTGECSLPHHYPAFHPAPPPQVICKLWAVNPAGEEAGAVSLFYLPRCVGEVALGLLPDCSDSTSEPTKDREAVTLPKLLPNVPLKPSS